jgi:hypothetical protein
VEIYFVNHVGIIINGVMENLHQLGLDLKPMEASLGMMEPSILEDLSNNLTNPSNKIIKYSLTMFTVVI